MAQPRHSEPVVGKDVTLELYVDGTGPAHSIPIQTP
jgi:hypothetical protein